MKKCINDTRAMWEMFVTSQLYNLVIIQTDVINKGCRYINLMI